MHWHLSYRADPRARLLAGRHYSRRRPQSAQFVPPGRCVVFVTAKADALWVSSSQEYVRHAWPAAWMCSCFRNESAVRSSDLIREAVAVTRSFWEAVPLFGMVTFVDPRKVRKKRDPGRCFRKAGWKVCGLTDGGLIVLQILGDAMPAPRSPANRLNFDSTLQPCDAMP